MKNYSPVATYPSSSNPSKTYTVSVDSDGNLSCTCPAWVFKKQGARTCKHVEDVERQQQGLTPASVAPPVVQAAEREKGGSLEDLEVYPPSPKD